MLQLYTDGSSVPNPGPGGWAVTTATQVLIVGHASRTTNNQMEGVAILEAIKWLAGRLAVVHTDSQMWVNTLNTWAPAWERRGWKKADGSVPANLELVQELYSRRLRDNTTQLQWVRGHNGLPGNELADEWAGRARTQRLGHRYDAKRTPF